MQMISSKKISGNPRQFNRILVFLGTPNLHFFFCITPSDKTVCGLTERDEKLEPVFFPQFGTKCFWLFTSISAVSKFHWILCIFEALTFGLLVLKHPLSSIYSEFWTNFGCLIWKYVWLLFEICMKCLFQWWFCRSVIS